MRNAEKRYTSEQQKAIDGERTRIARDLHDGPVQTIIHIGHKLEFIQHLLEKEALERAQSELRQLRTILETCLHALRYDISSLMTIQLEDIGDRLQALLNEYQLSEPNIRLTYTLDTLSQLPTTLREPLFRFVQEALNNVRKHAYATEISLHVYLNATSLLAEICDNGIGIHMRQRHSKRQHLGIRIMRERVQEVGGTVEFESTPGNGTCVKAIFPLVVA